MSITHIFSIIYLLVYRKLFIFAVNSKTIIYEKDIRRFAMRYSALGCFFVLFK